METRSKTGNAGYTGNARAARSDAGVRASAARASASPESAARVLRRFRAVFNAVRTHFQQVEKATGVGGAQVWALGIILAQPGIGVGALAQAMDVHQTTASNLVRVMVKSGLVVSQRDALDRRSTHLRVTPAGQDVLSRAPGPHAGVLPQALAQLDAAVLERLDADLALLLRELQADARSGRIPLAQI